MQRRTVLVSLAALSGAGVAGCIGDGPGGGVNDDGSVEDTGETDGGTTSQNGSDIPDRCPVNTIEGYSPPEEVTAERAEEFVVEYDEEYFRYEIASPPHEKDSTGLWEDPEVEDVGDGYIVSLPAVDVSDYGTIVWLVSEPVTGDNDVEDAVAIDEVESEMLATAARTAAETGEQVTAEKFTGGGIEAEAVPPEITTAFDSLPGDEDGRYVSVDGDPVRLWFVEDDSFHRHYGYSARYYVDSNVLWRTDDLEMDPREGTLVECVDR